jgi:type IV pilus assembly protein PilA
MDSSSVGRRGFTLIELLLVIGIIAILASIVIIAINPTKQLGSARNAQRRSDVNTLINAIYQYSIDHSGSFPGTLATATPNTDYEICSLNYSGCDLAKHQVKLDVLTGSYLVNIPKDPQADLKYASGSGSRYFVSKDSGNRVKIWAPDAEQSEQIQVTR